MKACAIAPRIALAVLAVVLLAAAPLLPTVGACSLAQRGPVLRRSSSLGLMLLMRTGLVSFGQGLYYCLGAYAAGAVDQIFERAATWR